MQRTGLVRLALVMLLTAASTPVGLTALPVRETATARSGARWSVDGRTGASRHSPARRESRIQETAVQPTGTGERGPGAGAHFDRAEGPEGGGGAGMLSPASAERPGGFPRHASKGNGADARGGEECGSRAGVGRGRPRRNMVAGHVVDVERLVSLVMSMGGALSVTAKHQWRVCLSSRPPPCCQGRALGIPSSSSITVCTCCVASIPVLWMASELML